MLMDARKRSLGLKRPWNKAAGNQEQNLSVGKRSYASSQNVNALLAKMSRPMSGPAREISEQNKIQSSDRGMARLPLDISCAAGSSIIKDHEQKNDVLCKTFPGMSELQQKDKSTSEASVDISTVSSVSERNEMNDSTCQTSSGFSSSARLLNISDLLPNSSNPCQVSPAILHRYGDLSVSQKTVATFEAARAISQCSEVPGASAVQQEALRTCGALLKEAASMPPLSESHKLNFKKFRPPGLANTSSFLSASNFSSRVPLSVNENLGNKQNQVVNSPQIHTITTSRQEECSLAPPVRFYSVMYCKKKKNAKHKGPWFDGILIVRGSKCTLQDTEGKNVCKGNCFGSQNLAVDTTIGKYEVEVMRVALSEEYESGTLFTGCFDTNVKSVIDKAEKAWAKRQKFVSHSATQSKSGCVESQPVKSDLKPKREALQVQQINPKDALTLNANYLTGGSIPVVVDPYLATKLRPHQREGVQFMYECVMGLRSPLFNGCLLADEMGLGKTVQVIALIWTLIQQSTGQWSKAHSSFRHIIVICPSSLLQNWGNEVKKWLGFERLKALIVHAGPSKEVEQKILDFLNGKMHPLLITSYELLRKHHDLLASAKPGLIVCDEAHRLKNSAGNKTIDALLALNCPRRVLLTGTPVQNDLNEFYAMVDFANPNLLGPLSAFKRLYTEPIELSRDRDASDEQKQVGQARFLELQGRTKFCILRRTAAINKTYLPIKTEYLVFCSLQPLQVSLYETFVKSQFVTKLFLSETSASTVLTAIGVLRKLCNHPRLVYDDISKKILETSLQHCNVTEGEALSHKEDGLPKQSTVATEYVKSLSGKLDCLCALLSATFESAMADPTEKVAIVSNFTQTLNFVQSLCEQKGWKWLRLDGATPVADRQRLVDRFNFGFGLERVFLLSSKAGGMGLNLVGANRLVLFDPDWNPATDAQAMARIWREGQKKAVMIYRLFSTGSIEEKIYQRQMVKGEIAATVEDNVESRTRSSGGRYFSREELRELFALNLNTRCDTYDLLSGRELPADQQWRNIAEEVEDPALRAAISSGVVTFVQKKMQALENENKEGSCNEQSKQDECQ